MTYEHLFDEEPSVVHLDELELLLSYTENGTITVFETKARGRPAEYTGAILRVTMEDLNKALTAYAAAQGGPVPMVGLGWIIERYNPDYAALVILVLFIIDANFSANGLVSVRKIAGWTPQSIGAIWKALLSGVPSNPFAHILKETDK